MALLIKTGQPLNFLSSKVQAGHVSGDDEITNAKKLAQSMNLSAIQAQIDVYKKMNTTASSTPLVPRQAPNPGLADRPVVSPGSRRRVASKNNGDDANISSLALG